MYVVGQIDEEATDEENAFKYNHNVCRMKKGILFTYHPINNNNNNICNL